MENKLPISMANELITLPIIQDTIASINNDIYSHNKDLSLFREPLYLFYHDVFYILNKYIKMEKDESYEDAKDLLNELSDEIAFLYSKVEAAKQKIDTNIFFASKGFNVEKYKKIFISTKDCLIPKNNRAYLSVNDKRFLDILYSFSEESKRFPRFRENLFYFIVDVLKFNSTLELLDNCCEPLLIKSFLAKNTGERLAYIWDSYQDKELRIKTNESSFFLMGEVDRIFREFKKCLARFYFTNLE